jgi:lysophospholipase L1-like esterase
VVAAVGIVIALSMVASGCGDGGAEAAGDHSKVTVAGDSISVGLGSSLRGAVAPTVTVKVIGQGGTGLARPDRFDWPARLEELAREFPPDVLVFSVGSNDTQNLRSADGDVVATMTEGWEDEYTRRLAAAFDAFEESDTRVVWVGHVRAEDPAVGQTNRDVHAIAAELAAERDWVEVQDLAELTGSGDDEVSECLASDGLHLSVECYDEASAALADRLGVS